MKKYFPYFIFWKSFWSQLLGYFVFLIFLCIMGSVFYNQILSTNSLVSLVGFKIIPFVVAYMILSSLWFSYKNVKPLTSIIHSVRNMVYKKNLMQWTHDESIYDEESGEYYELEVALSRVRKKLKKKYSQLELLQEETETILAAVGDAVVSVDLQQKFLFYNSLFAAQFMNTDDKKKAIFLSEILREPEILALFNEALSKGEVGVAFVEFAFGNKLIPSKLEKEKTFFKILVSPLKKSDEDEIYGAIGVFHDITALKQAERLRIEFLSNASHELRTPLTSVKGYVDTLKEDIDQNHFENTSTFVDIIYRNVNRLVDLVNDLFLISKLESNPELFLEDIDPDKFTQGILEELKSEVDKKSQQIIVDNQVKEFYADPVKMGQVLRNLLSNAIKYVPDQGRIEVQWVRLHESEGGIGIPLSLPTDKISDRPGVFLKVKDNGPGITIFNQQRLFERFYRVDKGRSRELGGTGLGLAIVKHIMLAHGGWVQIKSQPGQGAEFICFFPQEMKP